MIRLSLINSAKKKIKLTPDQLQKYENIIRVDHAGEFGANMIYRGQLDALGRDHPDAKLIQHMWDQEKVHLDKFQNELIPKYNIRATSLIPAWRVAGYVLGYGTAMMGKNAAMACTTAVEETIVEHYNDQLRELLKDENATEVHKDMLETIKKFRDEEQEHHDHGIDNGAEQTPGYKILKQIIMTGCKVAIEVTKKV